MKNLKKFKMIKGLGAPAVTDAAVSEKKDLPTMKKKKFGKALMK